MSYRDPAEKRPIVRLIAYSDGTADINIATSNLEALGMLRLLFQRAETLIMERIQNPATAARIQPATTLPPKGC